MHEIKMGDQLYPKFDYTDKDGNPIRDARFYQFVSRTISSFNKVMKSDYKYYNFDNKEN